MERPEDAFEQVRLVLARRRALGDSFEQAWALALGAVPPIKPNGRVLSTAEHGHNASLAALGATREAWAAAYSRTPEPRPCPRASQAVLAAALVGADRAGRQAA